MTTKTTYQAWVYGRKQKLRKLTPAQIISDLKKDQKLGREWSISPSELIEIISNPSFPELKGNEIKTLILNYCSECLDADVANLGEEMPNLLLITTCYYTSYGDNAVAAKQRYKKAVLENAIRNDFLSGRFANPSDAYFEKWQQNWLEASIKNFYRFFGPDIARWETKIKRRFRQDYEKRFSTSESLTPSETGN